MSHKFLACLFVFAFTAFSATTGHSNNDANNVTELNYGSKKLKIVNPVDLCLQEYKELSHSEKILYKEYEKSLKKDNIKLRLWFTQYDKKNEKQEEKIISSLVISTMIWKGSDAPVIPESKLAQVHEFLITENRKSVAGSNILDNKKKFKRRIDEFLEGFSKEFSKGKIEAEVGRYEDLGIVSERNFTFRAFVNEALFNNKSVLSVEIRAIGIVNGVIIIVESSAEFKNEESVTNLLAATEIYINRLISRNETKIWRPNAGQGRTITPRKADATSAAPKLEIVSSGSGFSISNDGLLVTNEHVIRGCSLVMVTDNGQNYAAVVRDIDEQNDLALLKTEIRPRHVYALSQNGTDILREIYVAGYPFGRMVSNSVKVTKGIVSSLVGLKNNSAQIQIDAPIQVGNSGGPVLDSEGRVVGVSVSKLDTFDVIKKSNQIPEGVGFAVKSETLIQMLKSNGVLAYKTEGLKTRAEIANAIRGGTFYISCLMTAERYKRFKGKKAMFEGVNLD